MLVLYGVCVERGAAKRQASGIPYSLAATAGPTMSCMHGARTTRTAQKIEALSCVYGYGCSVRQYTRQYDLSDEIALFWLRVRVRVGVGVSE